jgi:hypothetical protein
LIPTCGHIRETFPPLQLLTRRLLAKAGPRHRNPPENATPLRDGRAGVEALQALRGVQCEATVVEVHAHIGLLIRIMRRSLAAHIKKIRRTLLEIVPLDDTAEVRPPFRDDRHHSGVTVSGGEESIHHLRVYRVAAIRSPGSLPPQKQVAIFAARSPTSGNSILITSAPRSASMATA